MFRFKCIFINICKQFYYYICRKINYFRFGPSENFIFISVPIDNYNKYTAINYIFNDIIKVLIAEIGEPVVFNVYNPDKTLQILKMSIIILCKYNVFIKFQKYLNY